MGAESPKAASTLSGAVFLSYASQDAEAARKICDTLRAAGIEVWFDQSELRGGDAWDRQIRERIHDCRLFIAAISAHTEARDEGYFRREWRLAVERAGDMAERKAFIVPVVIDTTNERGASVPDRFRDVQWTRLPEGQTPAGFVQRVQHLLAPPSTTGRPAVTAAPTAPAMSVPRRAPWLPNAALVGVIAVLAAASIYLLSEKPWVSKHSAAPPLTAVAPLALANIVTFAPPPYSIAVLPFVNMSGDKDQEYFSDGLSEELLNDLARISELQVAARTSAFSFKGKDTDIATIARKLNVGAVLEGSVRRSGHKIRITAQLNDAMTGFHLWSQTYDRDLGDVLQIQTEIATAVAGALKVTLLGDVAAKIEVGGTRDATALDAYLRATNAHFTVHDEKTDEPAAIAGYSEAIRLDPNYALAFAGRSLALSAYATGLTGQARRDTEGKARADAREAIARAPDLAEGHLALATLLEESFDFTPAKTAYERALALAPGSARVLRDYGAFAVNMGWTDAGLSALRRAVVLDPLNRNAHRFLGDGLADLRRYEEAIAAYREALAIDPDDWTSYIQIAIQYYELGDLQSARSWCEAKPTGQFSWFCLALIYDKLGRHADAEAALVKFRAAFGDNYPYVQALVYVKWGKTAKALEWLEQAVRSRDAMITQLKVEPFFDPLRNEPRFQAIERELKFPD